MNTSKLLHWFKEVNTTYNLDMPNKLCRFRYTNRKKRIVCWIMWICTKLYYGTTEVEYPFIINIHVGVCLIVLYLAIMIYHQL